MKVLLAGFLDDQITRLQQLFPEVEFREARGDFDDWKADALIGAHRAGFDAVFASGFVVRCPTLRWVHVPAAGIEGYDVHTLDHLPFVLTNEKIIQGPEVADHALALALALTRRVGYVLRGLRRDLIPRPVELRGRRALVIGGGGVGLGIAERSAAFGMSVAILTETNFPYVAYVQRRYLVREVIPAVEAADVVFVAAPLTPVTRGMIDADALAAMPSAAYLVNVSRGAILDTGALVRALEAGRFAGVGLDVTDPEPLASDHPLRRFDRVIITPHMAGMSEEVSVRTFDLVSTNLHRFLRGFPLLNTVDRYLQF